MTTSLTRTSTFTFTDAVYVGSKLGAAGGQLRNDTPGGLPLGLSMNGYAFHSF